MYILVYLIGPLSVKILHDRLIVNSRIFQSSRFSSKPLSHCHSIKYPSKQVELTKTMREQLLMGSSDPKGRAGGTGGRDTLDLLWWDRVEATPHGHQVPVRDPPVIPPGMRSGVVFDHFKYPRGEEGQVVADRMYATGAMRRPVDGEARRNVELRRNMFEVRG